MLDVPAKFDKFFIGIFTIYTVTHVNHEIPYTTNLM